MAKSVQSFLYMSLVMTFLTKIWHFPVIMSAVQTAVKLNNTEEAILHTDRHLWPPPPGKVSAVCDIRLCVTSANKMLTGEFKSF